MEVSKLKIKRKISNEITKIHSIINFKCFPEHAQPFGHRAQIIIY